jgi:hypothetical protein
LATTQRPVKLKGLLKFGNNPATDFLKVFAKLGMTSPEFDPNTRAITVTVSDDDTIWTVTIPAGTMTEKVAGKKWLYDDKDGTNNGLKKALFVLANDVNGDSKIKFKTIKMDLPNAEQTSHDVTVDISFGTQDITDTRLWEFDGKKLKSTK